MQMFDIHVGQLLFLPKDGVVRVVKVADIYRESLYTMCHGWTIESVDQDKKITMDVGGSELYKTWEEANIEALKQRIEKKETEKKAIEIDISILKNRLVDAERQVGREND
jgi:hypothetical protein